MIRAMISYRSLTVLLTLLGLVLSAAPPPRTPQLLNLNDNDTTLLANSSIQPIFDTDTYKCSEKRFMREERRPTWAECYRAIRELPDTQALGTFHTGAYNDVWRLPRVEKFGACRVKVEIIEPRVRVKSSWMAVKLTLDHLGALCRRSSPGGPARVAGWMLMGEGNKIKVWFLKPHHEEGPQVAEAWNGTASE